MFFFQISVRDLFRCFDFGPRYAENPMRCTRLLGSPTRNWPFAPQKTVTRWGDYLVSADCISFGKGRLTWQAIFAAFFSFLFLQASKILSLFFGTVFLADRCFPWASSGESTLCVHMILRRTWDDRVEGAAKKKKIAMCRFRSFSLFYRSSKYELLRRIGTSPHIVIWSTFRAVACCYVVLLGFTAFVHTYLHDVFRHFGNARSCFTELSTIVRPSIHSCQHKCHSERVGR